MPRDGGEIGFSETKARRKRANDDAIPHEVPPASVTTPATSGAGDGGHQKHGTHQRDASAAIVSQIVELQKIRRFCIKSQSRCDRSIESLIASALGYRPDQDEKDRKALFRRAGAIRRSVEKGGEGHADSDAHSRSALSSTLHLIPLSAASRKLWDDRRAEVEKKMARLAEQLPVFPFVQSVRGLGAKGFAVLVGEAGIPIGDYRTVSGLWKRLGLAVINGERQRKKSGAEDAAAHGYSPTRRSEVWAICSDSLFRAQWRGGDEDAGTEAHPIGPYGEAYARRRAHTAPRVEATADLPKGDPAKWSKGRCHNDARRVMTKALLVDLWVAWRQAEGLPIASGFRPQ